MWHMLFSSLLAFALVRSGYVSAINMTTDLYLRAVAPIGILFAGDPSSWPSHQTLVMTFVKLLSRFLTCFD